MSYIAYNSELRICKKIDIEKMIKEIIETGISINSIIISESGLKNDISSLVTWAMKENKITKLSIYGKYA